MEIDTKADLSRYGDIIAYISEKTDDLLTAGVEKVIWILTKSKKILIAEQNQPWTITNWDQRINLMDGVEINMAELMNGGASV